MKSMGHFHIWTEHRHLKSGGRGRSPRFLSAAVYRQIQTYGLDIKIQYIYIQCSTLDVHLTINHLNLPILSMLYSTCKYPQLHKSVLFILFIINLFMLVILTGRIKRVIPGLRFSVQSTDNTLFCIMQIILIERVVHLHAISSCFDL